MILPEYENTDFVIVQARISDFAIFQARNSDFSTPIMPPQDKKNNVMGITLSISGNPIYLFQTIENNGRTIDNRSQLTYAHYVN